MTLTVSSTDLEPLVLVRLRPVPLVDLSAKVKDENIAVVDVAAVERFLDEEM